MSQPSHDAEVENVLSAIRRLMGEGGAPPRDPLGRLVLTPALRVTEPSEPLVPRSAAPAEGDGPGPAASDPLVLLNALPVAPPPLPLGPGEAGPAAEEGRGVAAVPSPPAEAVSDARLTAEDPDLADLSTDPGAEEALLAEAAEPSPEVPPDAPGPASDRPQEPPATLPSEAAPEPTLSAVPAADPLPSSPPPGWPDEATLRALVADVLREELRGELGERLTRNLRKLVRREVMQALALREG